jgi:hypothetical protein
MGGGVCFSRSGARNRGNIIRVNVPGRRRCPGAPLRESGNPRTNSRLLCIYEIDSVNQQKSYFRVVRVVWNAVSIGRLFLSSYLALRAAPSKIHTLADIAPRRVPRTAEIRHRLGVEVCHKTHLLTRYPGGGFQRNSLRCRKRKTYQKRNLVKQT